MTTTISAIAPQPQTPLCGQDDSLYEIIDGQRVELPPMSILASRVASLLLGYLANHVMAKQTGEAVMETLFRLPLPVDRNRRPDVAYVSKQRIAQAPAQPGSDNAWDVVPELMVEVISPHDLAEDIMERLGEYFTAGAKLAWVIYPTQRRIYVYQGLKQVHVLDHTDELDGGAVLPGFRIPIGPLFPG
jgi:Uma2 family endonuclease